MTDVIHIDTTRCVEIATRGRFVLFGDRQSARLRDWTDIRRAGPELDLVVVTAIAAKMPGRRLEFAEAGLAAAYERLKTEGEMA